MSMNLNYGYGHVIVVVDELDLLVDYLHGKYLKELDLILEKLFYVFNQSIFEIIIYYSWKKTFLMCLNEQKGIETDLDHRPDFD